MFYYFLLTSLQTLYRIRFKMFETPFLRFIESQEEGEKVTIDPVSSLDLWTSYSVPDILISLCVSSSHVWLIDYNEKLHFSQVDGSTLRWRSVQQCAQQVSVSPSGRIVWVMYRGMLYAATKISSRMPAGTKWEDFVQSGVAYMSVSDTSGWWVMVLPKNSVQCRKVTNAGCA